MASDIKEAIRRMIYQYTVEGADKVVATQEAVAASTTKTDKASLSLEKSFGSIERRYVDTVRAQQDYQKVQERVNAAVAQNPALQERANVVLAQAKQHFESVATGASKADMAASVLIRTMSRTLGPLALVGAAVTAISSAMEFMEPIAVRVGTDIYRRFSEAYPAAAQFADGVYNAAKQFVELERAQAKLEAINAALKGTASSAELAALNMESLNQKMVNQRGLAEAAQAAERMADHVMRLREIYPGVTQEVAKQLELLDAQLAVAQARTEEEKRIAEEKVRQVELTQQGLKEEEQQLIIARERAKAEAASAKDNVYYSKNQTASANEASKAASNQASAVNDVASATNSATSATDRLTASVDNMRVSFSEVQADFNNYNVWWSSYVSIADRVANRLNTLSTQFGGKQYVSNYDPLFSATQKTGLEAAYGAANIEPFYAGVGGSLAGYRVSSEYLKKQVADMTASRDVGSYIGGMDISSPAAIQQSLVNVLALGFKDGLGPVNRLVEAVGDPATQMSLIAQTVDYIQATQAPSLAREEMIQELNSKLESLANSTDSLNATMQNALSPFYSQDPRTTKLGFRAGVVGNPDWMISGASNTNPLAAILGPGATAPGMASGGSFVVGGGYSANDNRIAAFPVASGEEVVVNRNRQQGGGAQVIHIDNRIIVTGSLDSDAMSKLKVSRYQQQQRMRSGLAQAS